MRLNLATLVFLTTCMVMPAWADNAPIRFEAGGRLYLSGSHVMVPESVGRSLSAVGGTVVQSETSSVAGDAYLAAEHVALEGHIKGGLEVRARQVLINGTVDGNVSIWAAGLQIGPDAQLGGDLSYTVSTAPFIDAEAEIDGQVEAHELRIPFSFQGAYFDDGGFIWSLGQEESAPFQWLWELKFSNAILMGVLAGVLMIVASGWTQTLTQRGRFAPVLSIACGVGWIAGLPFVILLAGLTLPGLPVVLVLMLLYVAGWALGSIVSVILVGSLVGGAFNMELTGNGRRLLAAVVGALTLWVLAGIPLVGTVVWFAAMAAGIGAVLTSGRAVSSEQYKQLG